MKRTIEIKDKYVYYNGEDMGHILPAIEDYFHLHEDGKYEITIIEGSLYNFYYMDYEASCKKRPYYYLYIIIEECKEFALVICREVFEAIFFIPEKDKRYDIIVKKVK